MANKKGSVCTPPRNQLNNTIKQEVLSTLKEAEYPLTAKAILGILRSKGFKIQDTRVVRKAREELVKEGHPICSSAYIKGFWLAKTEKQKKIAVKDLQSKAEAMLEAARELSMINVEEYWNEM